MGEGEGKVRTIVSGLVKFIPIEEMLGRRVVVICNMKPAPLRGIVSLSSLSYVIFYHHFDFIIKQY